MSNKTKTIKDNFNDVVAGIGIVTMSGAMAVLCAEVGGIHPPKVDISKASNDKRRIVLQEDKAGMAKKDGASARPRHAEEVGPHHVSYGSMQRTPARSGAV